jgi:hypothetical protein
VTPLKSQLSPFSSFKGEIQQKYFNGKYPHTIQVLEAEKSLGMPKTSFSVSSVSKTLLKPILVTFEAIISANTMPYVKRF